MYNVVTYLALQTSKGKGKGVFIREKPHTYRISERFKMPDIRPDNRILMEQNNFAQSGVLFYAGYIY